MIETTQNLQLSFRPLINVRDVKLSFYLSTFFLRQQRSLTTTAKLFVCLKNGVKPYYKEPQKKE
jgi:hypothetical protein